MIILDNKVKFKYFLKIDFNCLYEDFLYKTFLIMNSTSKKITFSAFGRDSYYHRDWFKQYGFKFDRNSRKRSVPTNLLPTMEAKRTDKEVSFAPQPTRPPTSAAASDAKKGGKLRAQSHWP